MRNALAHVSKGQHTVVAAAIRQAFDQPDRIKAGEMWRHVADQLRGRWPKLADLMDDSEHELLAYMAFPRQHPHQAAFDKSERTIEQGGPVPGRRCRHLPERSVHHHGQADDLR